MQTYILKRILLFVPTMFLVTVMVFLLMRLIPGDPALAYLVGDEGEGSFTQEQLAELRAELGTDRSLIVQYGTWIWDMVRLDFGTSVFYRTPIGDDLKQKIPITIELAILAVLMAAAVAIPLGIVSAVRQDTAIDYVARVISIGGVAMPTFWVGILVIYFLVKWFDYLPIFGYVHLWTIQSRTWSNSICRQLPWGSTTCPSWPGSRGLPCWRSYGKTTYVRPGPKGSATSW